MDSARARSRRLAVSGEPMLHRAPSSGAAWTALPRHSLHAPNRESGRASERPGARRHGSVVDDTVRTADPAQRLLNLTDELGRLAGEIAQGAKGNPAGGIDARFVRGLIRARQRRAAAFGSDLFADPVWDMMLDLLAARLEGRPVSTSSLCIAAGVPGTTALRWLRQATERGLFVRVADPRDGRGVLVELSDEVAERLLAHLAAGVQA
jgi:DNA-binding transcriptional ArsR family regulator